ncbi:ABC transporter permease [Solibacillus silvestris]|nr:ABC transporter permease [Solibacillus silvestris]OBW59485.1 ABC transporter permease [Solibacillus silvestris]
MFGTDDYKKIEKNRKHFIIFNLITILFFTGISFTYVIPNLKGFDLGSSFIVFLIYIVIANVFVGIFVHKTVLVFFISLIFSALGMGWRLWLEWGEFSLVEHTNIVVMVGYPCITALIITLIYAVSEKFKTKKLVIIDRK